MHYLLIDKRLSIDRIRLKWLLLAWVARLIAGWKAVVLKDGVLVCAAWLFHVLVPPDLHPGKKEDLNAKQGAIVNTVIELSGIKPAANTLSGLYYKQPMPCISAFANYAATDKLSNARAISNSSPPSIYIYT